MIGRLRGTLIEKMSPEILIECHGVGYEVTMPMTSIYALPELNQQATLYTHFVVREDAQLLYGFANKVERKLFRLLIKVNGVGPKLALAILSGMSADQFVSCVVHDDLSTIVKIPGVGKKTAERLIVEMRDKLADWASEARVPATGGTARVPDVVNPVEEAVGALIALGYKAPEASRMVRAIDTAGLGTEDIIRSALQASVSP